MAPGQARDEKQEATVRRVGCQGVKNSRLSEDDADGNWSRIAFGTSAKVSNERPVAVWQLS